MPKLRQNHSRNTKGSPFRGIGIRVFLLFLLVGFLFIWAYYYFNQIPLTSATSTQSSDVERAVILPEQSAGDVVRHTYYTLGYSEHHEQALWVTYELNAHELKIPNVKRAERFKEDPLVHGRSSHHRDFSHSGYTRGHLAPAGDMAFNEDAMQESFYMSNISPQVSGFNGGIWRELEETVRDWAYSSGYLWIATGPIFDSRFQSIGKSSDVAVPSSFYKLIVDPGKKNKGIAFIIPHEVTDASLTTFAMSIDDAEKTLNLDFFDSLMDQGQEEKIESRYDLEDWPLSKKRYNQRIDHWNQR